MRAREVDMSPAAIARFRDRNNALGYGIFGTLLVAMFFWDMHNLMNGGAEGWRVFFIPAPLFLGGSFIWRAHKIRKAHSNHG